MDWTVVAVAGMAVGLAVFGLIGWSIDEPPITQYGPSAVVPNLDGAPIIQQLRAEE